MTDNIYTGIREIKDIKTFEETLNDTDFTKYYKKGKNFDETYTTEMAQDAIKTGKITVYNSYPIKQGVFITPLKLETKSYAGNNKIYEKTVDLNDIAWINPIEG
ncbi:MAG: hypothetical protein Q4G05_03020 [Clostridia bacterium]|nr:hypothetical protein [Clostridia bacterium]